MPSWSRGLRRDDPGGCDHLVGAAKLQLMPAGRRPVSASAIACASGSCWA